MVNLNGSYIYLYTIYMIQNKLVDAKEKNEAEGSPMTMDQIFDSVLPSKAGYVKGLGPGPKAIAKGQKLLMQQKKEAEERARAAEERNVELMKQMAELKARQESFEQSMVEKMRADTQALYRQVGLEYIETPEWMGKYTQNGEWNQPKFFQLTFGSFLYIFLLSFQTIQTPRVGNYKSYCNCR